MEAYDHRLETFSKALILESADRAVAGAAGADVVGRAETFRSVMYAARRKFTFDTIFGRSLIIVPLGPEAVKLNELFDANESMESFVQQKLEDMMEPGGILNRGGRMTVIFQAELRRTYQNIPSTDFLTRASMAHYSVLTDGKSLTLKKTSVSSNMTRGHGSETEPRCGT